MAIYLAYILIDLAYVHAAQTYAVCYLVVYQKHTLGAARIQLLVFVLLLQDFVLCIPPEHTFGVQCDFTLFSIFCSSAHHAVLVLILEMNDTTELECRARSLLIWMPLYNHHCGMVAQLVSAHIESGLS